MTLYRYEGEGGTVKDAKNSVMIREKNEYSAQPVPVPEYEGRAQRT